MESKLKLFYEEFPFLHALCRPEKVWGSGKVRRVDLKLLERKVLEHEPYGNGFKSTLGLFDREGHLLARVERKVPWYVFLLAPFSLFIYLPFVTRLRVKDVIRELGADAKKVHTIAIHNRFVTVFKPPKNATVLEFIEQLETQEREKLREV